MSIEPFLDRIEATGLIDPALMAELRKRAAESNRRLRPEMIAKLLVDRGELTASQARKLVMDQLQAETAEEDEDILTPAPPTASPNDDLTLVSDDDSDDLLTPDYQLDSPPELGLAEPDDEPIPEADLVEDDPVPVATAEEDLETQDLRDLLDGPLAGSEGQSGRLKRRSSFLSQLFARRRKKGGQQLRWDSPLILLGGGGLILLVAAGVAIFLLLYSESVDEIFTAGEEAYASQAYGVAIEKFEWLATKYPQHENASLAKVKIELAKLRKHTDRSNPDWPSALSQAQQGLPTITTESALNEVRAELAKLLPDITDGLIQKAATTNDLPEKKRFTELSEQALELVHDPVYLPTTVKKTQELRIEGIEAQMDVVRRDIQRADALHATAEQIGQAAAAGRIVEAYALRDDLVAKYPILIGNVTLNDALSNVADKERAAVKVADGSLRSQTVDHAPVSHVQLVLSDRRGDTAANGPNQIYPVLARGAVYAIRVSDGNLLWRRYVGYDSGIFPEAVSAAADSDLLLVDAAHSELQRVAATTGTLRWRLACPGPISAPRVIGDRAYVCCGPEGNSKLVAVDLASGNAIKELTFPVGCHTPAGIVNDGKQLAVPGLHSSIYIVDTTSLECVAVIPSGHSHGSILTSPTWLGGMLVVAENTGSRTSQLQRYRTVDDGSWTRVAAPIACSGRVLASPAVDDRRLLIHTDLGQIRIFEVPISSTELREVAQIDGGGENMGQSHAFFSGSQVWLADQKLTRYQLQATRGELVSQFVRDKRDVFQNPIRRIGSHVLSVRQRHGMLGVTVTAHSTNDSQGEPVWQTDLAVPSEILVSSQNQVYAMTANGALFPVDNEAVKSGLTDRTVGRIDTRLLPTAFSQTLAVSPDLYAFASPPPTTHMVVADLAQPGIQRVPLRIDADIANTALVAFQGAVLAACETGPIHALDARSGRLLAKPFVPRMEPGVAVDWMLPAEIDGTGYVAAERNGKTYLVGKQGDMFSVVKQADVAGPLVAGLAALGTTTFAVSATGGAEELIAIDDNLVVANTVALPAGVAWGPQRVDRYVLVTDHAHTLFAFGADGALLWSAQLPDTLAGPPLAPAGKLVVTTVDGTISVVDGQSGKVDAQQKLSEPLGGSSTFYKGRLLVVGWDGTLYLVEVPKP